MRLLAVRPLRYLAHRFLAAPHRSSLYTARANAAEALAILQERRRERDSVDAYLLARLGGYDGADEDQRASSCRSVENTH